MSRQLKIVLIILGFVVGLYIFLGAFGIFAVYKNATWSNEPNIKEGELNNVLQQ